MERLDVTDFVLVAELHTGIAATQLTRMPHVMGQAASALAAPFAGFGDVEVFPTFAGKTAAVCSRIVRYHPLPDGNKRVGYHLMREFLHRNGGTWRHPPGGELDTADVVIALAAGELDEPTFITWIGERLGTHD